MQRKQRTKRLVQSDTYKVSPLLACSLVLYCLDIGILYKISPLSHKQMNTLQYNQEDFLGSGAYSDVFKVNINGKNFALKKIHPYILKDKTNRKAIYREIDIMKQIDHPNIVKFYQCIQSNQNQLNLLLQYADGGTLYEKLKAKGSFQQNQAKKYIKRVIKAVKYLHGRPQPILHRDIKPENILLTKKGQCKLADFGSSNILDGERNSFVGTKQYMAPQLYENSPYGKEVDMWCLGVLIYEMLLGKIPEDQEELGIPNQVSRAAEDVIKKLLVRNPENRMTLQELEEHIWLVQPQEEDLYLSKYIPSLKEKQNKDMDVVSPLQRLRKLKKQNQELQNIPKSQKPAEYFLKQQNQVQEKQKDLGQEAEEYLELIKLRSYLQSKLRKRCALIQGIVVSHQEEKFLKYEQIYRFEEKVVQYQKNIQLLKNSPLKFRFECEEYFLHFLQKVTYLEQYLKYIPEKTKQKLLDFPESPTNNILSTDSDSNPSSFNEELANNKTRLLRIKREILEQLLSIHKVKKSLQIGHD